MTATLPADRSVVDLLAAVDDLFPLLQAEADASERLRRPTPVVQTALRDSGVLGLMLPHELGGFEAGPLDVIEVLERLSHADASIGWLVRALMTETAIAACHLPDATARELFAVPGETVVAGVSSGQTGTGVLLPDGDLRVGGRWRFAPGTSMATHVNLAVRVDGTGEEVVCVVPRWAVVISDNWEMLGLQASSAFDIEAVDVVVPASHRYTADSASARRGGVVSRLSPALLAGLNQSAWSQGVARRMLDELRALAQRHPDSARPIASEEFFAEYARHFSHVRGTMALLMDTWRTSQETWERGGQLGDESETMVRLACSLATRTSLEISQLVHRFAGAQVMRNGLLQRLFRDSHVGTQHRGSTQEIMQQCGRILAGALPPGSRWGEYDVVVPVADGDVR